MTDGSPVVLERGRAASAATAPPAAPREGYYVVKKGDTLYRIAKNNGVEPQDLVAWNNLPDATKIEVGQELRVALPEGAVEVKPIAAPAPLVAVGETPPTPTGGMGDALKRDPKGGTLAYSDTALSQVREMDGGVAPARPIEAPAPAVAPAPAPAPVPAPAPTPAPAPSADSLDWTWPAAGKVIGGFVDGGAGKESNKGIDVTGRMGEPIYAAAAGTVTYVGSLRGYGDFLVVRHNSRYISVYAHTSKILVKKDQTVTRGQKIAEIGSSDADRPRLHFEIRQDSNPVDPLTLLPARQ
ncbi:MAG TPA: peptidoglycan DD-metalloendopeptidase family protein [Rhodocyclaceae bacterium]|nr:peptidoglycan DD-metalloendopeptidase family protein [Rhodocyclaceae bacterium]